MPDLDEWLIGVLDDEIQQARDARDQDRLSAADSERKAAFEHRKRLGVVGANEPTYCEYCPQWTPWPCEPIKGIAALYDDRAGYDPRWAPAS